MNGGDGGIVGSTVHIISGGLDPQGEIDRLRAEVERLTVANERIETEAHGIDESLSLLSQQYKALEAERDELRDWIARENIYVDNEDGETVIACSICRVKVANELLVHAQNCVLAARKAGEEPR